ncbi:MAG: hypothetical protein J6R01_03710 [Alistipes sp.]|nr:hypothetical protein [Alistipes sp.]
MRYLTKILTILIVLLGLSSCFKDEKQGTLFRIAVYSQNVSSDPILKTTTELQAYAFYVDENSKWEVKTWEDALNATITNKDKSSVSRNNPDVIGTWNSEAEYQIEMGLWSHTVFMLVVDTVNKVYATRLYTTPMNLPITHTQLHLYAWRKSGSATGWDVVNPFPDEEREPLVPSDDNNDNEMQE